MEHAYLSTFLRNFDERFAYEKSFKKGTMTMLHYHQHHEIYYLLTGTQRCFIDNAYYDMKAGDFALIRENSLHKTTSGMGGLRILISFNDKFFGKFLTPDAIEQFLSVFDKHVVRPSEEANKLILSHCNKIDRAVTENNKDDILFSLIQIFLLLKDSPSPKNIDSKNTLPLIDDILNYIGKNFSTITNLDDVSKDLHISKYYICHLFQKHLETSFTDYLTKIRLKNAQIQLATPNLTITEIAENCGFRTPAYFSNVFKKQLGISPLKYRQVVSLPKKQ